MSKRLINFNQASLLLKAKDPKASIGWIKKHEMAFEYNGQILFLEQDIYGIINHCEEIHLRNKNKTVYIPEFTNEEIEQFIDKIPKL